MPGLLDFIQTPEGQGLLSAAFGGLAGARKGQPINSIGRAGLAGLSGYTGAQDRAVQLEDSGVKRKYMQSQIDENVSQNATRAAALKRSQDQDAYFMGGAPSGLLADAPTSPGAYVPSTDGMGPVAPMPAQGTAPTMGKFDEWSAQFKIPKDALIADYRANGGKGIAEMLYKRGAPDMTVNNGYLFDRNQQGAGFLPSLTTSQSGQTSMTRIGADGLPVVSAPQGALDTYGAYQRANEGTKAAFDPLTVTGPDGRPVMSTRGAVVSNIGTPKPGPGNPNGDQFAIMSQELDAELKKPNPNPEMVAGLRREIARLPKGSDAAPSASGLVGIPLQSEAEKTTAIDTAKADVVRDTANRAKVKGAKETISSADRAIELLRQGPTGSGIGTKMDDAAAVFGKTTQGAQIAAQLDVVSADMVKNVPRFEGPQSDKDVEQYKSAAGRVADRTLPVEQRIKAAEEVKLLQARAVPGTTTESKPRVIDTLPTANAGNRGQRIRDTTTGKVLVSNGLQWKPE